MRAFPLFALALTSLLLLSGCSTPSTPEPTPEPEVPVVVEIPFNQTGCSESIGLLLVDPAPVQALLPKGYMWRDAADLLGLPQPTGKAAVGFNLVSCAGGATGAGEAFEGVFIQPPGIANITVTLAPATLDIYQFAYWTGNMTTQARLAAFGVDVAALEAGGTVTDTPAGSFGEATVTSAGSPVHSMQFAAAAPQLNTALARFWTQTGNGAAVFDYNVSQNAAQGTVATCSFGASSVIAAKLAITSCVGQTTAALRFPVQAWTGSIRLLYGVAA